MNATLASQILEEQELSSQEESPSVSISNRPGLVTLLLLPPVVLLNGLLPLFYLGLAGLIGWGVLEYSHLVNQTFASLPKDFRLAIGLVPVVPAMILINALIRPLFSPRPEEAPAFPVTREEEPLLVSFIHQIAEATGAPRPGIIELNCDTRTTARFSPKFGDSELRIVIGMPLIASLSRQSLGGALARELGPFSHPLFARLKGLAERISSKFQRMSEWKSPDEIRIEQTIQNYRENNESGISKHWVILPCLSSIRACHVAVRIILKGFSFVSRASSAFLLRKMEYQADLSQVVLAGSANFSSTVRLMTTLEAASKLAREKVISLVEDNRLSRDFPNLVDFISSEFPTEPAHAVREKLNRSSSWMEFRPSIKERIQAAYRRDDAGIFSPEKPASSLIRDPRSLGELVTRHWYRTEWDIDPNHFELVSNESLNRDSAGGNRQLDGAKLFFGGSLNVFRPIFPSRETIGQFSDLPEIPTDDLPEKFADQVKQNRELLARFDELVDARLNAVEFHQLALAGYPPEAGRNGQEDNDPAALNSIVEFLDRQLLQVSTKLGPFEERSVRLIAIAAGNLGGSRERNALLDNWFYHLAVVEQIYSVIPDLKDLEMRLSALVRRQPDSDLSGQCGERFDVHMKVCELLKRIEDYLGSLPYPFDDFGDQATMWDYLTADVGTRNEAIAHSAAMANAIIGRIGEFYLRVMGQLAMDLSREVEEENSTLFGRWAKLASL